MEHMTGIEIKCNQEQKDVILEVLTDGLYLGKLSSKEYTKELLENQIVWKIIKNKECSK